MNCHEKTLPESRFLTKIFNVMVPPLSRYYYDKMKTSLVKKYCRPHLNHY